MTLLKLAPLAAFASLALSACGGAATENASSVLDVPSIDGSITEYVDRGGPFSRTVIRLAVMGDGQVAWFQGDNGAPEAFVKYVGSLGTGATGNIRAISTEANLAQADSPAQLVEADHAAIPCTGLESDKSLILRRAGGHSTLALQKRCWDSWNPSLIQGGFANGLGMEVENLFLNLDSLRFLAARR